jgi:SAM-dependent methyltransferase
MEPGGDSLAAMRRDWEARAAADPLFHINANQREWTVADFYRDGSEIVDRILDPVLERLRVDPTGGRVLEIGCGMGRLFPGLAARFADVWGIDISSTMVARGRKHCPVPATWLIGDGRTLRGVKDASVDHVLSFEVFQHIPDLEPILSYIAETRRVLRPGGTFQLQLRRASDTRAQAAFRTLPRSLRVSGARVLRTARVVPVVGDIDTWLGCIVDPVDAAAAAEAEGFVDVVVLPDAVHEPGMGYWLVGRAPAAPPAPGGSPAATA